MTHTNEFGMPPEVADYYAQHGHCGYDRAREAAAFTRLSASLAMLTAMPVATDIDVDALPESMGVRDWYKIENQGAVGQCGGEARAGAMELAYFHAARKPIQFNRRFSYLTAQRLDGTIGDSGSSISANAEAGVKWGLPLESDWAVSDNGQYPRGGYRAIPEELYEKAAPYKIRSWKQLNSYDESLAWLAQGVGGLIIAIPWTVRNPGRGGKIESYTPGGPMVGWHALPILDWNKQHRDSRGKPCLSMPNSWGPEWGDEGWSYVSPGVVDRFVKTGQVIGISDMVDIKPRPFDWSTESFFSPRSLPK